MSKNTHYIPRPRARVQSFLHRISFCNIGRKDVLSSVEDEKVGGLSSQVPTTGGEVFISSQRICHQEDSSRLKTSDSPSIQKMTTKDVFMRNKKTGP